MMIQMYTYMIYIVQHNNVYNMYNNAYVHLIFDVSLTCINRVLTHHRHNGRTTRRPSVTAPLRGHHGGQTYGICQRGRVGAKCSRCWKLVSNATGWLWESLCVYFSETSRDFLFPYLPSGVIKHGWMENPQHQWKVLARKINELNGPFSQCLITRG